MSDDPCRSLNDRLSRLSSRSLETSVCLFMVIAELHYAIFIAIKRPVAAGSKWPFYAVAIDMSQCQQWSNRHYFYN